MRDARIVAHTRTAGHAETSYWAATAEDQTKGVFFEQSQQLAEMVHGPRMFQIRSRRANSTIRTRQQLQAIQLGVDPADCLAVPPGAVGTPAFQATLRRIAQRLPSSTADLLGDGLRVSSAKIPRAIRQAYRTLAK